MTNGGFEKGLNKQDEPVGWHTRITGIIPVPEYEDPVNKKVRTGVTHFRCGCRYNWGEVRPWAMLVCPQCGRVNAGLEDSGDLYHRNHEFVSLPKRGKGKALAIDMPPAIGNNQGVRVISPLIKAQRGAGYEISFEALSQGAHLRVFVEGFRVMKDDEQASQWVLTLPSEANPLNQTTRLKRVYRAQVNAGQPGAWQRFSDRFTPPKRSQFDYMFVSLYAYLPGKAAYDNVVLRKLSPRELKAYLKEHPGPKDKRLR